MQLECCCILCELISFCYLLLLHDILFKLLFYSFKLKFYLFESVSKEFIFPKYFASQSISPFFLKKDFIFLGNEGSLLSDEPLYPTEEPSRGDKKPLGKDSHNFLYVTSAAKALHYISSFPA